MCQSYCSLFVLLGAAFTNGIPVWFYNTGFENNAPIGVECSSFTRVYNPNTGYFSYRCNPNIKNLKYPLKSIIDTTPITDVNSAEEYYRALQSDITGRSGGQTHTKNTMYRSLTSGRSGSKRSKINKNKRPKSPTTTRRRYRCPHGQIFQSELNICIDYPSSRPLSPKLPSNIRLTPYNIMMGDAPVRISTFPTKPTSLKKSGALQKPASLVQPAAIVKPTPASGTILLVGKIELKNRCQPSEVYVSELDICLPANNCYPYGSTC